MPQVAKHFYEFGSHRLDPAKRVLLLEGKPLPLTAKVFDTLLVLVERRAQVVEKDELMKLLWPDSFVEEANLSQNVSILRKVLGENPNDHHYIVTIPGRGYRFVAAVTESEDEETDLIIAERTRSRIVITQDGQASPSSEEEKLLLATQEKLSIPGESSVALSGSSRRRAPLLSRKAIALAALSITVLGGVLLSIWLFRGRSPARQLEIKSIAVLPLENLSGDSSQDYFADGMTDVLITDLAKIGALRVISRQAVMKYKGTRQSPSDIARELKVDALVGGTVLRSRDRVRITAQLIHPATDRQLWAESYERDLRDILALQREVARTIANEVRVKLTAEERTRLAKAPTINPEAYDFYLRGKSLANRRNKSDNQAAIELLERAVKIDPAFATAYAELALVQVERFFYLTPEEQKELDEKANLAVEKALLLDPDLAEAHLARALLLWTPSNHFPHEEAIQQLRRSLDENPNLDEAHRQLAIVYGHIGLLDEGLKEARKAASLNPASKRPLPAIGNVLLWQGKYEEALPVWQSIPKEFNPPVTGSHIAWALFQLGRRKEASAKLEEFLKDYPEDAGGAFAGMQALVLAAAGQERNAEDKIKSAAEKKGFGHFHHTAYWIASAYARMNKPQPAIHWLQQAADNGFPCYPLFERDPNLDALRKDPRFITFMDGLKKQWEHYKATI